MTSELTGAERYLASRMDDSDYREAYEAAVTGPMNVITLYQPYGWASLDGVTPETVPLADIETVLTL